MNPFKKLKQLLMGDTSQPAPTSDEVQTNASSTNNPNKHRQHTKVVADIMAWFDEQSWKYEYRPPENDLHTHHLIAGFTDNEHDWTCVFRIHEQNDLVTIFGILDEVVPVSHYTAVLMAFAKVNMTVGYGSLELDVGDGEVRAKLAFDGEFTTINDKSLGCYMQAVAGLTELARGIVQGVLVDDSPSQFAGDYLEVSDEIVAKVGDDKQSFFVPTQARQ